MRRKSPCRRAPVPAARDSVISYEIEVRTHANTEGELDLTGARIKFRALHDLHKPLGRRLLVLALLSVSQVLIPDITFANDPGFADNDRPARATAGVAT